MSITVIDPSTLGENPRKAPGVSSFVACNQQGRILYLKGTENSGLATLTPNMIQMCSKLGESLNLLGFESVVISEENSDAVFIKGKDQNSGCIVQRTTP